MTAEKLRLTCRANNIWKTCDPFLMQIGPVYSRKASLNLVYLITSELPLIERCGPLVWFVLCARMFFLNPILFSKNCFFQSDEVWAIANPKVLFLKMANNAERHTLMGNHAGLECGQCTYMPWRLLLQGWKRIWESLGSSVPCCLMSNFSVKHTPLQQIGLQSDMV